MKDYPTGFNEAPSSDADLCTQPTRHLPGCECNTILGVPRGYRPPVAREETRRFEQERQRRAYEDNRPTTNSEAL